MSNATPSNILHPAQLWLRVFLPFAFGYFLSYLLRSTNAVIAPELMLEINLSAADMGLLTSAYLLAFAVVQLPLGLLLDRFEARYIEAPLLLITAIGCLLFALGENLVQLTIARALIGLGVSACLMAAFKTFALWFRAEQQASLTGAIMSAGGLGALAASLPLEAALPLIGWRGTFGVLAVMALLAAMVVLIVPATPVAQVRENKHETLKQQLHGLAGIFSSLGFWRYAPQMILLTGGFMAVQGLWAVPWLMNVNGLTRNVAAGYLFLLALGLLAGYLLIALLSTWLARRGIKPIYVFTAGNLLVLLTSLLIILDAAPLAALWMTAGLAASVSNLAYSLSSAHFPLRFSGRATTALNLLAFAGAFFIQWGFGVLVDMLSGAGWPLRAAYQSAFATLLILQAASFVWFVAAGNMLRR